MDFDFLSFLHCFARAEKVELLRWAKSWVDWFLLPLWKVFWLKVMCSRQNTFGNTGSNSISSLKTLGRWCCRVFAQVHIVDPIDSVGAISPSTLLLVLHSTFLFSITLKAKTIYTKTKGKQDWNLQSIARGNFSKLNKIPRFLICNISTRFRSKTRARQTACAADRVRDKTCARWNACVIKRVRGKTRNKMRAPARQLYINTAVCFPV